MAALFYVTGMHNSGTSLVARYLEHLGVDMGSALQSASEDVPYLNYEDLRFRGRTYDILEDSGLVFWPDRQVDHSRVVASETTLGYLRAQLGSMEGEMWGFKEPYNALTLAVWIPEILDAGFSPRVVHVFRRPADVVDSLIRQRPDLVEHFGDQLPLWAERWWQVFNWAVIDYHAGSPESVEWTFVAVDDVLADDARFCAELGLAYRPIAEVRTSGQLVESDRVCDDPTTIDIWDRLQTLSRSHGSSRA